MRFPCSGCGACCRRVDKAVEAMIKLVDQHGLHEDFKRFPYTWDEHGKCSMLDKDDRCKVYENRPLLCNVEALGDHVGMARKDFFNMNIIACNRLIEMDGLPGRFRLKRLE